MELQKYKNIIKDTVELDMPNYIKQKIVNEIVENNVGKYGTKEVSGIIKLTGMTDQFEKINTCLSENNLTIKLLDLCEIKKGYRYSIIFKYNEIDFTEFKNSIDLISYNIDSEYYTTDIDESKIIYSDDEDKFILKFHKILTVLDKKNFKNAFVRYPTIVIFHKHMNLFEVRFDKLADDGNYEFYNITLEAILSKIKSVYHFNFEYFDIEDTIREIVKNHKDSVKEIIWSFESARSKGLTLKVGEDGIMPFLGELEQMINDLKTRFEDDKNVESCLGEIENYMNRTAKFANEKFRILSWLKYEKDGKNIPLERTITLKVTFNYNNQRFALLNIYENEINDMERINHVVRFIGKIARSIGKL